MRRAVVPRLLRPPLCASSAAVSFGQHAGKVCRLKDLPVAAAQILTSLSLDVIAIAIVLKIPNDEYMRVLSPLACPLFIYKRLYQT